MFSPAIRSVGGAYYERIFVDNPTNGQGRPASQQVQRENPQKA